MATTTVLFSGPLTLNDGHAEGLFSFLPPAAVSGRSCYLKVCNVTTAVTGEEDLPTFTTLFITMDLPQPCSYASVNNAIFQSKPTDKRMRIQDGRNNVVALIHTGGVFGDVGGLNNSSPFNYPRILVEIPDGPQFITIGLWSAISSLTTDVSNLTVMLELTAIDSDEKPELNI